MTSNTSLYGYSATGNATIPANNNTSLYNATGNVIPVNGNINANNVNVSNNVNVGGQISATGNITTAGYFIGDGGLLSNIASSYGNANVAAFLPTYTGNLAGDNLALQGAAAVTGNIITSGYLFGNGSQLTGIGTNNYGNANVAAFLPTYTGNLAGGNLSVVATVTGANINSTGGITAQDDISTYANVRTLGPQGNIVGANYVSANYFVGDGSLLTNVVATGNYSNANVAAFLPVYNGNVNSTTVFGQGLATQGYDYVQMQYSNAVALPVDQYNIGTGSWFYLDPGGATWQSNTTGTLQTVVLGNDGSVSAQGNIITVGNISGANINGNGSGLSSLNGANVTGTVANATYAINAGTAANATYATSAGTAASATTAGTVTTAAQPNITSVGTLTSLSSSGNIATAGILTNGYYYANGTPVTFGGGSTYGNSNVTALLAAFGSNTISTTGAVTTGNITLPSGGRIFGDWGNGTTSANLNSRTAFQSSTNTSTTISMLPPLGLTLGNGVVAAGINIFNQTDMGNAALLGLVMTNSESRLNSISTGTVAGLPFIIRMGNASSVTERFRIDLNGNVGLSCTTPNSALVVGPYTATVTAGPNDILAAGNLIVQGGFIRNIPGATGYLFNQAGNINIGVASAVGVNIGTATSMTTMNGNASVVGNITVNDVYVNNGKLRGPTGILSNVFINASTLNMGTATTAIVNIGAANSITNIAGNLSAVGNVTGSYFIGNGSQLTGIATSTYGNANVIALGETGWSGNIVPSANSVYNLGSPTQQWNHGYFAANTIYIGGVALETSNGNLVVNNSNVVVSDTNGNITTDGNISAATYTGNGSQLTDVVAGSANVATNVTISEQGSSDSYYKFPFVDSTTVPGNTNLLIDNTGIGIDYQPSSGNVGVGNLNSQGDVSATGNITGGNIIGSTVVLNNGGGLQQNGPNAVQILANLASGNSGAYFNDDTYAAVFANTQVLIEAGVATWTFDTDGSLSAPGNITTTGNIDSGTINTGSVYFTNTPSAIVPSNTGGIVIFANTATNLSGIELDDSYVGRSVAIFSIDGVLIETQSTNNPYQWWFYEDGSLSAPGNITTTTGNIAANYFIGNGSQLTGITSTASDSISPFLLMGG
jgi:hypothetical protein